MKFKFKKQIRLSVGSGEKLVSKIFNAGVNEVEDFFYRTSYFEALLGGGHVLQEYTPGLISNSKNKKKASKSELELEKPEESSLEQ